MDLFAFDSKSVAGKLILSALFVDELRQRPDKAHARISFQVLDLLLKTLGQRDIIRVLTGDVGTSCPLQT